MEFCYIIIQIMQGFCQTADWKYDRVMCFPKILRNFLKIGHT